MAHEFTQSLCFFYTPRDTQEKKKKTVKKNGVEYHHGPGKVRRMVAGGQKEGRRGTCVAD